ncbi:MAG: SLOG family protein [Oscillospiraceae bacterium]|nr:SLOG family protein [Oscillospiraceae bacterium]
MANDFKSCCFTGYRPQKFPFALERSSKDYIRFENKLVDAIFSLPKENCYRFYTGGAMGFDIIAAEIVLMLRDAPRVNTAIELYCVVPFIKQADNFDEEWRQRYENVLNKADKVILISDNYYPGCYQKRNEFMVDNSDFVVTWYDGAAGGTRNTLNYATKKQKRIINLSEYGVHEYICDNGYEVIDDEY